MSLEFKLFPESLAFNLPANPASTNQRPVWRTGANLLPRNPVHLAFCHYGNPIIPPKLQFN